MARSDDPHRYDDIIDLPHPVSLRHRPMAVEDRAAQFAPFAALTGYEDAIEETARLTDRKIDLDEDARALMDRKWQALEERLPERPEITVLCFRPDERKDGGAYVPFTGRVRRIDRVDRTLTFTDGTVLPLDLLFFSGKEK